MPKRDSDLLVQDMLDATRKIEMYTAGLDHQAFLRDERELLNPLRVDGSQFAQFIGCNGVPRKGCLPYV